MIVGSLRSYDGCCNENDTLKLTLRQVKFFMIIPYLSHYTKQVKCTFVCLARMAVILRQRMKILSLRVCVVVRTSNTVWKFHVVLWQTTSNIAPKSVPHVQHDYFSSFSQSSHWFMALSWSLPSSFLKLRSRKFKIWRRQRQRQRHKSMIWLVEWEFFRATRAARFLVQCFVVVCQRTTENFLFEFLTTTRVRSSNCFILCL